jgi:hypothetical protein
MKHEVLQGSIPKPLLFITHVNDLLRSNSESEPILFTDDIARVIISR